MSIEPSKPTPPDEPDVPNFIDENPNLEAVEIGMNVAENEKRDMTGADLADEATDDDQGDD